MEVELKTLSDGRLVAVFPVAELAEELKAQLGNPLPASQTEGTAKLQENFAHLEDELKKAQDKVAELESPEHEDEIISKRVGSLTKERWVEIGEEKGYFEVLADADLTEWAEEPAGTGHEEGRKPHRVTLDGVPLIS